MRSQTHAVTARASGYTRAMQRSYGGALRVTLRQTAAAYGYTLTIASTVAVLTSTRGKPETGDVFLFVAGGLAGFALLEVLVELSGSATADSPEQAFPFAGALNFVAVGAGLGASVAVAHIFHSGLAWLLAPLIATAAYLLAVAGQVTVVDRLRGPSK